MASEPQPCEITLHGLTSLENRRPAPGKPKTYIYDAIFPCTELSRDAVGSFRHYVGDDNTKKQDDVYDIRAKVCPFFLSLQIVPYLHITLQIVSFKPGRNLTSDYYNDDAIDLLGEIRTVCMISLSFDIRPTSLSCHADATPLHRSNGRLGRCYPYRRIWNCHLHRKQSALFHHSWNAIRGRRSTQRRHCTASRITKQPQVV